MKQSEKMVKSLKLNSKSNQMKVKSYIIILIGIIFILGSCKNDKIFQGEHDPEVIKTYRNQPTGMSKMDSIESVNYITRQKIIEIYELTSLYTVNQNDSLMREDRKSVV